MDAGSIDRLEVRAGEPVTAAHLAILDRHIMQNQSLRGLNVRRRIYPWGTHYCYTARGGSASAPVFQPSVSFDDKGTASVSWLGPKSLVGGLVPTIGSDPNTAPQYCARDPKTGELPSLKVPKESYDPDSGECGVYFKVTVYQSSFEPAYVQPVAVPLPPGGVPIAAPYTALKLALFLRLRDGKPSYDETADRDLFSSVGFLAVQQRPDGHFKPVWWSIF